MKSWSDTSLLNKDPFKKQIQPLIDIYFKNLWITFKKNYRTSETVFVLKQMLYFPFYLLLNKHVEIEKHKKILLKKTAYPSPSPCVCVDVCVYVRVCVLECV